MKQVRVCFEADPSLDRIEVLIRAPEENAQVGAIRKRLSDFAQETLILYDRNENRKLIPTDDIVSVSVNGKVIEVVTESGSYTARQALRSLENVLDPYRFVRISRYEIVNLSKVVSFDFTLAGTLRLELVGGMETWASRRCIPLIRKRLMGKG